MRQTLSTLLCLTIFAASCTKADSNLLIPEGTYSGTFQRQTSSGGQISNVTIIFSANNWSGQSQFEKYPALCRGTYKANGIDSISFENACPWTTDFDGRLILSKDYKIKIIGNNIEISRDYNGALRDIYNLTKQ